MHLRNYQRLFQTMDPPPPIVLNDHTRLFAQSPPTLLRSSSSIRRGKRVRFMEEVRRTHSDSCDNITRCPCGQQHHSDNDISRNEIQLPNEHDRWECPVCHSNCFMNAMRHSELHRPMLLVPVPLTLRLMTMPFFCRETPMDQRQNSNDQPE